MVSYSTSKRETTGFDLAQDGYSVADEPCSTCTRPASRPYCNAIRGEHCVDKIHDQFLVWPRSAKIHKRIRAAIRSL